MLNYVINSFFLIYRLRKPGSRAVPIVAPPKPEVAERKSEEAAPVKEEESKSDDQAAVVAAVPAVVVEAPLEDVPAVPAAAAAANNGGESGDSGNEDEGQFSDPEAEQGAAAAVRPISPQVQAAGPGFAAALEQERGEEKSR